ncbi:MULTISPECIES: alpha/beta hydrolase [unclassified Sporolactobacillus]|uniref:alpha/beta hydrolase n=1 Tax=unclassified Sporolactobacillus TaxID=2628533 RepID=UPI002368EE7B|nr:alpha/beta hydrolase [Sporolactobacillus sp. CQH2019]MDD9148319.1 alpha/beta fold hydrolase [Sporolactobacillus sp. CQH2019]
MPILHIDDYRLHYDYRYLDKKNPTLLLLHDLSVDSTVWHALVPFLDPSFNILVYDYFGHGKTTDSAGPVSFEKLFREILSLMHTLRLDTVHLAGSGFGGVLAFLFAENYPRLVRTLSFMSMPFYVPEEIYRKELHTIIRLFTVDRRLLTQKIVAENVYPVTPGKTTLITNAFNRVSARNFEQIITVMTDQTFADRFSLIREMSRLKLPVLIMSGEFDPLFPANLSVILASQLPNGRGLIIPEASHLIELDQPKIVAARLNFFIRGQKAPFPFSAAHQKAADELKRILDKGFSELHIRRPSLRMTVMKGTVEILWDERPIEGKWNQRHARELLFYIIMNHGSVTRTALIDTFMPELAASQAKTRLRVQLNHLNKIFQHSLDHALMISREAVALNVKFECDLLDFMEDLKPLLLKEIPLAARTEQFIHKLNIYNPSCLAVFQDEWSGSLIEKLEIRLSQIMIRLLEELESEDQTLLAKEMLKAGTAVEPYDGFCKEKLDHLS